MTGAGGRRRALAALIALCLLALAGCVAPNRNALPSPSAAVADLSAGSGPQFADTASPTTGVSDSAAPELAPPTSMPDTADEAATAAFADEPSTDDSADADTDTSDADETPILDGDPWWHKAIETPDGAYMGVVTAPALNVRAAPSADAAVVDTTYAKHLLTVYDTAWDEAEQTLWYRVGAGRYVAAQYVQPFVPPDPPAIHDDHWVDVNLTDFYAIAYDGSLPVYAAIITAGRDNQTPLGVYTIKYRVRVDDMTSATLGTPASAPGYYDQPDVEYAQYFKAGGFAIHGNYWTPPDQFGTFTSHGCVGLLNPDAAWFWRFLDKGSTVDIHT